MYYKSYCMFIGILAAGILLIFSLKKNLRRRPSQKSLIELLKQMCVFCPMGGTATNENSP